MPFPVTPIPIETVNGLKLINASFTSLDFYQYDTTASFWQKMNTVGLPPFGTFVSSLVSDTAVYALINHNNKGTVYVSKDDCLTWSELPTNIPDYVSIRDMKVMDGHFYLSTSHSGIWTTARPVVAEPVDTTSQKDTILVAQTLNLKAYPNPAEDELIVTYDFTGEPATIRLYSMDGREIWRFTYHEVSTTLNQKAKINLSEIATGIYVCEVRSGNKADRRKIMVMH